MIEALTRTLWGVRRAAADGVPTEQRLETARNIMSDTETNTDLATIPAATPATVARRGRIAALADAGIGATDAPTIERLRTKLLAPTEARDAIACLAGDHGHGISQAAALAWARETEARAEELIGAILGDAGKAREIAAALVAHGFRAVLR